jgi:hypothetical protein
VPPLGIELSPVVKLKTPRMVRAVDDSMGFSPIGINLTSGRYVALTVTCTRSIFGGVFTLMLVSAIIPTGQSSKGEPLPGPWSYEIVISASGRFIKKADRLATARIPLQ